MGMALAFLFVALAGAAWGTFRTLGYVPNGSFPVVAIPGPLRLALELLFFLQASRGLWVSGWRVAGAVLVVCTVVVYRVLVERTMGLLQNRPPIA